MRRADGRAFVIDAAGSAEITDASSAFLRALASAGTAPPRADGESADGIPSGAAGAPRDALVSGLAPRAALPAPSSPAGPRTRSAARRREYFPRANRLYEALTGARRRREGDVASAAGDARAVESEVPFSSPGPATAPLAVDAAARRRAFSPGALDRRLSLDDRHVGDATGLRRRRRRLEWDAPPERSGERDAGTFPRGTEGIPTATEGADGGSVPVTERHPDANASRLDAERDAPRPAPPEGSGWTSRARRAGGLDIARVARELGESLRATRGGAGGAGGALDVDVEAEEDGGGAAEEDLDDMDDVHEMHDMNDMNSDDGSRSGDVGRRGVLRARVAFLADTLLTILREVDARLVSEGDDDGLGRFSGLLGSRANAPAEARDLAALAPTTVWDPASATPDGDDDETGPRSRSRAFYGAGDGCAGDGRDAPQCYICLEAFRGGEEIRELPCRHAFHRACVDKWLLRSSRKCPTCRAAVPRADGAADAEARRRAISEISGNPARVELSDRSVLALPPARPNLFFLPAPEGLDAGAVPERVASPAPRTRA